LNENHIVRQRAGLVGNVQWAEKKITGLRQNPSGRENLTQVRVMMGQQLDEVDRGGDFHGGDRMKRGRGAGGEGGLETCGGDTKDDEENRRNSGDSPGAKGGRLL